MWDPRGPFVDGCMPIPDDTSEQLWRGNPCRGGVYFQGHALTQGVRAPALPFFWDTVYSYTVLSDQKRPNLTSVIHIREQRVSR